MNQLQILRAKSKLPRKNSEKSERSQEKNKENELRSFEFDEICGTTDIESPDDDANDASKTLLRCKIGDLSPCERLKESFSSIPIDIDVGIIAFYQID
jgi:hypothetical protein